MPRSKSRVRIPFPAPILLAGAPHPARHAPLRRHHRPAPFCVLFREGAPERRPARHASLRGAPTPTPLRVLSGFVARAFRPRIFSKGRRRQEVRQRSAKPPPPVQIRAAPPLSSRGGPSPLSARCASWGPSPLTAFPEVSTSRYLVALGKQPIGNDITGRVAVGDRRRWRPSIRGISVRKYVVANKANSTRPASVSAMAAATAMFRVANSVASVNRSGGDAPVAAPINQPARNDAATNVAASGTLSRRPCTKHDRVARDDQHDQRRHSAKTEGPQVGLRTPGERRSAEPHPHPESDRKGEHQQQLRENQRERHGESHRVAQHRPEDQGKCRNGHDGQEAGARRERHGQRRRCPRQVAVRVRNAADRARGDQQQSCLEIGRRTRQHDQEERQRRQDQQRAEQARGKNATLPTHAREVSGGEVQSDGEQRGGT